MARVAAIAREGAWAGTFSPSRGGRGRGRARGGADRHRGEPDGGAERPRRARPGRDPRRPPHGDALADRRARVRVRPRPPRRRRCRSRAPSSTARASSTAARSSPGSGSGPSSTTSATAPLRLSAARLAAARSSALLAGARPSCGVRDVEVLNINDPRRTRPLPPALDRRSGGRGQSAPRRARTSAEAAHGTPIPLRVRFDATADGARGDPALRERVSRLHGVRRRRRAGPPALRHQRRRRLPQHPPARPGPERQRARDRQLPRPPARGRRTTPTSSRCTRTSSTRRRASTDADIRRFLQGRQHSGSRRRGRAHLQPAQRRDDRPRPVRRPAHLRQRPRRGDVRRRLHRRRGPDVLHRRPAPRGPRPARLVRRRQRRQPGDGPQRLRRHPVPQRRRAPGPVRPRRGGLRPGGVQVQKDVDQLCRRDQQADLRDPRQPAADAGRVRAARPPTGPRGLEGHRRDLDRLAGGRDLRQGRRRRGRLGAGARGGPEALRQPGRDRRLGRLPERQRPGGADDGSRASASRICRCRRTRRRRLPDPGTHGRRGRRRLVDGRPPADRRRPPAARSPTSARFCSRSATRAPRTRSSSRGGRARAARRSSSSAPRSPTSRPRSCSRRTSTPPAAPRARRSTPAAPRSSGTNLYVQLGHGRDYAWSATSAGQDIIDTFAVPLCNADGSKPTIDSTSYMFRGQCLPIDVLERTNSWTQSIGDTTPSGSETYRARADRARDRHPPGDRQGPSRAADEEPGDLLPRGRLLARVRRLQQPRADGVAAGVHGRGLQDPVHVQLVLRRPSTTSPTSTRASTRSARTRRTRTSRSRRGSSGSAWSRPRRRCSPAHPRPSRTSTRGRTSPPSRPARATRTRSTSAT